MFTTTVDPNFFRSQLKIHVNSFPRFNVCKLIVTEGNGGEVHSTLCIILHSQLIWLTLY